MTSSKECRNSTGHVSHDNIQVRKKKKNMTKKKNSSKDSEQASGEDSEEKQQDGIITGLADWNMLALSSLSSSICLRLFLRQAEMWFAMKCRWLFKCLVFRIFSYHTVTDGCYVGHELICNACNSGVIEVNTK